MKEQQYLNFLDNEIIEKIRIKTRKNNLFSREMNELELHGLDLYPYKTNEEEELEKYSYYDGLLAIYLLNLSMDNVDKINTLPDYLNHIDSIYQRQQ